MLVKAQRVSKMRDNTTLCSPAGVSKLVEIDLDDYTEVAKFDTKLPESNENFPKGAADLRFVVFDNKIFKKNAD